MDIRKKRAKELKKLLEAARPLLKLLCEDYHSHHTVIVTSISVELLQSTHSEVEIYDYLVD